MHFEHLSPQVRASVQGTTLFADSDALAIAIANRGFAHGIH